MSALPKGWIEERLSDVCDLITDGTHHSPSNGAVGSFKYVTAKNIKKHGLDLTNITYVKEAIHREIYARCPVKLNDILYIKDGATTGIAIVNPLKEEFSMLSSVALLRPIDNFLESQFLCYQLNSASIKARMTGDMTGSAIRRLTLSTIGKQAVNVPPPAEQKRIVAKLDALNAKSTRARTELARIETLVARYKQAVLGKAFNGELAPQHGGATAVEFDSRTETKIDGRTPDLPSLPPAWNWVALGSAAEISGGLTKNSSRVSLPLQLPYLRVANVYANELRLNDVSSIGCTENEVARTTLRAGDLLLVEGNGSLDQIGRVALWSGELDRCVHQNHLIKVRPSKGLESKFALYWLLSPLGRRAIEAVAASSAGLHTLSLSKVGGLPLPLCNSEEQHEIVRRIESAFAKIDRLAAEAKRALDLLGKLDEAILAKAFRGELVPQDEADEPAGALLARIRAERAAAPQGTRGKIKNSTSKKISPPRGATEMVKSRIDVERNHLSQLLKVIGGRAPASDLWLQSEMNIDEFYKQLRAEIDSGQIAEGAEKGELVSTDAN